MIALILAGAALAAAELNEFRFEGGAPTRFVRLQAPAKGLVTERCVTPAGACRATCEACARLAALSPALKVESAIDQSPGAAVCAAAKGQSKVGVDASGGERSFCFFSDDTAISSGALYDKTRKRRGQPRR